MLKLNINKNETNMKYLLNKENNKILKNWL